MNKAYINFISSSLPEKKISNKSIADLNPKWNSESIFSKIGINNRHILDKNESTIDLIISAVDLFFNKNNCVKPVDIDGIILCTQTSEISIPTNACLIQNVFNMRKDILTFDYNLGCSGYVYGLSIAKGLILSEDVSKILVITAEAYSKRIHKNDYKNRSIFGDGATVTLVSNQKYTNSLNFQIGRFSFGTDGSGFGDLFFSNDQSKNILKKYSVNFQNPEFENSLHMDGGNIFNFTMKEVPVLVNKNITKNDLSAIEDIKYFIFHQANAFMLNAIRRRCKIPQDKFIIEMKESANTVSSTIPIAFQNSFYLSNDKNLLDGQKIMLVGFGVGLSMAACTITYENS